MLNLFRKGIGTWFVKGFMVLLSGSFLIWGIADVFRNFTDTSVAQLGKVKFTQDEFRELYSNRMRELSKQMGRVITPDQSRALGLDRRILSDMLSESALDQEAQRLGINVSDKTLAQKIKSSPEFAGPGGFSHEYFLLVLRSNRMSEAQYIENQRRLLLRAYLGNSLVADLKQPKVMSDAFRRYQSEERSVDYVTLGAKDAGAIPAATPEQLKAFYDEKKAAFRAPEYRKLQMIVMTPETIAAGIETPESELRKIYDSQIARFTTPEKRDVEQIVFKKPEEAAAASARIASGLSFDALVKEKGLAAKDVSLGTVTKHEILDPAVADAAFALASGKVSAPVAGRFGTVILRVDKVEPSVVQSFASVSDELRKQISSDRARREVLDLHDKIEDERASGATIPEIAAKLKVKFDTIDAVDRSGRKPDGSPAENLPDAPDFLTAAFRAPVGTDNDTIDLRKTSGYLWYDVVSITPSRERSFDEVKSEVETRWKNDEIAKKLVSLADDIRAKLDSGQNFAQAAPGMAVAHRDKLVRNKTTEGFDGPAIGSIFATPNGKSGIFETSDGVGRVVYRITATNVPVVTFDADKTDTALNRGLQDDVLVQYIQRAESDLGVKVNEAGLRSVTGADRN
jgi:peptidyl-prolyl cis-trans isomerase D